MSILREGFLKVNDVVFCNKVRIAFGAVFVDVKAFDFFLGRNPKPDCVF